MHHFLHSGASGFLGRQDDLRDRADSLSRHFDIGAHSPAICPELHPVPAEACCDHVADEDHIVTIANPSELRTKAALSEKESPCIASAP